MATILTLGNGARKDNTQMTPAIHNTFPILNIMKDTFRILRKSCTFLKRTFHTCNTTKPLDAPSPTYAWD
jgi:hypothetical protein